MELSICGSYLRIFSQCAVRKTRCLSVLCRIEAYKSWVGILLWGISDQNWLFHNKYDIVKNLQNFNIWCFFKIFLECFNLWMPMLTSKLSISLWCSRFCYFKKFRSSIRDQRETEFSKEVCMRSQFQWDFDHASCGELI